MTQRIGCAGVLRAYDEILLAGFERRGLYIDRLQRHVVIDLQGFGHFIAGVVGCEHGYIAGRILDGLGHVDRDLAGGFTRRGLVINGIAVQ